MLFFIRKYNKERMIIMKKLNVFLSLTVASAICFTSITPIFAQESDSIKQDSENSAVVMPRTSNSKYLSIPGGKGKLTANAWRSTNETTSGNTYQWDYQVSAVYSGKYAVEKIRTTWVGSASLRNSASISLGITGSGVNAGVGSSWQNVETKIKYWENNNGAKNSSARSNMIVSPRKDYRKDTIAIKNTARVKLKVDAKPYEISASC